MSPIHQNIAAVCQRIAAAARRVGRSPSGIELLIVSKTFPATTIAEAAAFPHRLFGESRVQEAVEKIPQLPPGLRWHFIGHLQSNKIRKILPFCEAIHSVDSLELARHISRIATELRLRPKLYLQVNVAQDSAKFGFSEESVAAALPELRNLPNIEIAGLMTIPHRAEMPEEARPHFAALRRLRDSLAASGASLPGLSMGMSGDFEVAVEEGATIVRVGSLIFGDRIAATP